MTKNEALACIDKKDWMRARTVDDSRIRAMFYAILNANNVNEVKLVGRTLAFYFFYKFYKHARYIGPWRTDVILNRLLTSRNIISVDTEELIKLMSLEAVINICNESQAKQLLQSVVGGGDASAPHAGWFNESLLLSKEDIQKKIKDLRDEFPERFEGVDDEKAISDLKNVIIDYLDGCTCLTFRDTKDDDKEHIVDLTGNSTAILERPEYEALMKKTFEEVVDNWLEEHNLTHGDIVSFRFDPDTNQMFVEFDANEVKFDEVPVEQDDEPFDDEDTVLSPEAEEEMDEALTFDALTKYEKELWAVLRDREISVEDVSFEDHDDKLVLTVIVDGDWKHDHLYCEKTVQEFVAEHNFTITYENSEVLEEDGSDSYKAMHWWELQESKEPVREDALEETYSDEELDALVGKTFNQQKIQSIYRRQKYNDSRLFAHTRCVNCGREKRVFLSNLINDPDKYGSCTCSDTNVESRLDNIHDLFDGSKKLSNNTSGYTGVSYIKTSKGQLYDKWRAYIEIDGKRTYLGDFDSKSAAVKARKKAAEKGIKWYNEHKNEFMKNYRRRSKRYRAARRKRTKPNKNNNRSN